MNNMTKLTEGQFHTVWTEAVGRPGYDKPLFQGLLNDMKQRGLVVGDDMMLKLIHIAFSNGIKAAVDSLENLSKEFDSEELVGMMNKLFDAYKDGGEEQ